MTHAGKRFVPRRVHHNAPPRFGKLMRAGLKRSECPGLASKTGLLFTTDQSVEGNFVGTGKLCGSKVIELN